MSDWENHVSSTLDSGITDSATTLTVDTGDGALFPQEDRMAFIFDQAVATPADDPNAELVQITGVSGDDLTIVRAQEGTTNKAWSAGDKIWHILSAGEISTVVRRLVQRIDVVDTSPTSLTTLLPVDDTIPQITEGDEIFSQSVTPDKTGNIIEITFDIQVANISASFNGILAFALFDGSTNAIRAWTLNIDILKIALVTLTHRYVTTSTAAKTFSLRGGPQALSTATYKTNSNGLGNGLFGGVEACSMIIKEFTPEP